MGGKVHRLMSYLQLMTRHCNSDGRSVWTAKVTMLQNKPYLIPFHESTLVSLWTFQQILVYYLMLPSGLFFYSYLSTFMFIVENVITKFTFFIFFFKLLTPTYYSRYQIFIGLSLSFWYKVICIFPHFFFSSRIERNKT